MDPCPICASTDSKTALCKTSLTYDTAFDLVQCNQCRCRYFYPLPDNDQLTRFYSDHSYTFDRWRQQAKADYYLAKLLKQRAVGNFLDIGCASGYLIDHIKNHSEWQVHGVELSEAPARFARETLGLDVFHGDLFDAAYADGEFDAVYVGDVLEHVPDPVAFMRECHRILKKNGMMYLAVPNGVADSRGLIEYYNVEHRAGCHASGHIYFFDIETLGMLFADSGFGIENSRTVLIKNGLRELGYLPRKRNWKNFFTPASAPVSPREITIEAQTRKPHSDLYYKYHFYKKIFAGLPGLHRFGFNFLLELRAL